MVSKHQLRCQEEGESGQSPKSRSALFPESSQMISPSPGLSSHLPTSGKYCISLPWPFLTFFHT